VHSAISAVNLGATKYLPKPFDADLFVRTVTEEVHRRVRRQDLTGYNRRLDAALDGLWMAYQPIVSYSEARPHAYEALLRTTADVDGPTEVLELAEKTHRLFDLGRRVRATVARDVSALPPGVLMFVNLHPADLEDPELYDAASPLSLHAGRVVLELTERASVTHDASLERHISALHALGYRLAVDDLGAGYAGLTTLARVKPEYVKLDGSLVRDVDTSTTNQIVIKSIMLLAQQLDMRVVAEAIETPAELKTLRLLGLEYLQGYLLARPARPFVSIDAAQLQRPLPAFVPVASA
jgi:EAL domain-containing protein (putative c-di-GMP-specific phosphodiesterase class I)